jgi:hypothetical protein
LAHTIGIVTNGAGSEIACPMSFSVHTRRPTTRKLFDHAPTANRTGHSATARRPGA